MNILIWLFDSVSKNYFKHNLQKTWTFLDSLSEEKSGRGGFLLEGHNLVGYNSMPNLVSLWTGETYPFFYFIALSHFCKTHVLQSFIITLLGVSTYERHGKSFGRLTFRFSNTIGLFIVIEVMITIFLFSHFHNFREFCRMKEFSL